MLSRLTVRELMSTDVVTLEEDEDLLLADDVMRLGKIRHLPVVNEGKLVGLVTSHDVLRASVSCLAGLGKGEEAAMKKAIPVREVMRREVLTVDPEELAATACATILEKKIGCLPVVQDGRLLGIVCESDFARLALRLITNGGQMLVGEAS